MPTLGTSMGAAAWFLPFHATICQTCCGSCLPGFSMRFIYRFLIVFLTFSHPLRFLDFLHRFYSFSFSALTLLPFLWVFPSLICCLILVSLNILMLLGCLFSPHRSSSGPLCFLCCLFCWSSLSGWVAMLHYMNSAPAWAGWVGTLAACHHLPAFSACSFWSLPAAFLPAPPQILLGHPPAFLHKLCRFSARCLLIDYLLVFCTGYRFCVPA